MKNQHSVESFNYIAKVFRVRATLGRLPLFLRCTRETPNNGKGENGLRSESERSFCFLGSVRQQVSVSLLLYTFPLAAWFSD